jgi:glutathione S-transferase
MLKIWGRENSINVQKVLWCCAELDVNFERVDAGGTYGGTGDPGYLALNPNGLVPTIKDGSLVLWESNVIVRYLCAEYGGERLFPKEPSIRANIERWMDWQLGTLWAAMRPAYVSLLRVTKEDRDETAIQSSLNRTAEAWTLVEAQLEHNEFVAGPSFTMADIPLGATAYRWLSMDIQRPPIPNIDAWYARLRQRPAFIEHVMLPLS